MSTAPKSIFEVPVAQTDDPFAQLLRGEVKSPEITGNFQAQWNNTYKSDGTESSFKFVGTTTGRMKLDPRISPIEIEKTLYEAELRDREYRAKKEFLADFDREYSTGWGNSAGRNTKYRRVCPVCGDPDCDSSY